MFYIFADDLFTEKAATVASLLTFSGIKNKLLKQYYATIDTLMSIDKWIIMKK
jgi:hypothetical protein